MSEAKLLQRYKTNNNIDHNIQDILETILNAADKSIPNKLVTIKSNDSPWITCHIKSETVNEFIARVQFIKLF